MEARETLPASGRLTAIHCYHLMQARRAEATGTYAESALLQLDQVLARVTDQNIEEKIRMQYSDGEVHVYLLPGGVLAVPVLGLDKEKYMLDFVHIRT